MSRFIGIVAVAVFCGLPQLVRAQTTPAPAPTVTMTPPKAGDCSLIITLPAGFNPALVRITLDSSTTPLKFTVKQKVPLVAVLSDPLKVDSEVTVRAGEASTSARVLAAPDGGTGAGMCDGAPVRVVTVDERKVFEASGFLGEVIDNFAPAISGNYVNTSTGMKARLTAGVEAQYRIAGTEQDSVQFWLVGYTLHGNRSADASCGDAKNVLECSNNKGSLYIFEHASTLEAHIDARLELFTIQKQSDTPAKFYVFARAGFLDLDTAPKIYDSDSVGVGMIAPKGVFRNSYVQVGVGNSKQYESDPHFDRFKMHAVAVFDVLPGLASDGFFGRLGSGTRFFVAISIDRSWPFGSGNGPDAVQTYLGADFDLRRMFGGF